MRTILYYLGFLIGLYLAYLGIASDFNVVVRIVVGILGLSLITAFIREVLHEE